MVKFKTDYDQAISAIIQKEEYEKWAIRAKTRYAAKMGVIKKPNECEVCKQMKPLQAHHHDYTKHLEVTWLCSRCHANTHNKIKHNQ